MHPILACLVLAAAPADPAVLITKDTPICLEIRDASALATGLLESSGFQALEGHLPPPLLRALRGASQLGVRRATLGLWPVFGGGAPRWCLVLEAEHPRIALERIREVVPAATPLAALGGFLVLTDSERSLNKARDCAEGRRAAITAREDFVAFRKREGRHTLSLHVDLQRIFPLRPGVDRPRDAGGALLAAHLLSVAAQTPRLSGHLSVDGGLEILLEAPFEELPEERRFAVPTGPSLPALAAPEGALATLSLRRDLAAFWAHRDELIPEGARAGLAEFQNNFSILLGGLPVEDTFAALGTSFDLYLAPLPASAPATTHRLPAAALVAHLRDPELRPELYLAMQTVLGVVNAQAGQEHAPRLLQETERHRDVLVVSAGYLAEMLADPRDDRLQLQPTLAIVGERLILGTHRSIVRKLIDHAVDGRTRPRPAADVLHVDGPATLRLLEANREALAARMVIDDGTPMDEARDILTFLFGLGEKVRSLDLSLGLVGKRARLGLELNAPGLLAPAKPRESH